jgi:hypothetical protein
MSDEEMNRREAIGTLAGTPLMAAAADEVRPQYYELRKFQLRNGTQPQRANDFFSQHFMPAAKRAGLGPVGAFSPVIGEGSPYVLLLIPHASFADAEHAWDKLMADPELGPALDEFHKPMDPGYVRSESTLLRAMAGQPQLKLPEGKDAHVFELRTYESNSEVTLRRKVEMFNAGEIHVFQKLGMQPVFFAEALFGSRMPHLTYMLAYKDLAARDALWNAFGSDPEWAKLRSHPGWSDPEIVSNINNAILRGARYSEIR